MPDAVNRSLGEEGRLVDGHKVRPSDAIIISSEESGPKFIIPDDPDIPSPVCFHVSEKGVARIKCVWIGPDITVIVTDTKWTYCIVDPGAPDLSGVVSSHYRIVGRLAFWRDSHRRRPGLGESLSSYEREEKRECKRDL